MTTLTMQEEKRLEIIQRVFRGELTVVEATMILGVSERQWLPAADAGGVVSPMGRYAKHCAIALDRPLKVDDDLNNPAAIFSGAVFSVYVGFRKTERQRGGMASDGNAQRRKDDADYLRVHEILSREEL